MPELQLKVLEVVLTSVEPIVDLQVPHDIDLAVLSTSKWIRKEGVRIYLTENTFHFSNVDSLLERTPSGISVRIFTLDLLADMLGSSLHRAWRRCDSVSQVPAPPFV